MCRTLHIIHAWLTCGFGTAQKVSEVQVVAVLYLLDSILQSSRQSGRADCGPTSAAALAFRDNVARILPR